MIKGCDNCKYTDVAGCNYPCDVCVHGDGTASHWEPKTEFVNHPPHYNKGKIEVADFISDQKLNFDRGNAVKYVCRAGSKDPEKEIQDLEKAIWYINHEIKILKGDIENGTEKENT